MKETGDYEVGYKKPPKEHRFQPGNRMASGRTGQRTPTIERLLQRKIHQKVKVTRGGRVVAIPLIEAIIERMIKLATTGNAREVSAMLNLIREMAPNALARPEDLCIKVTYVTPPPDKDGHIPLSGPPAHLFDKNLRR
jgi:hypothetical protein